MTFDELVIHNFGIYRGRHTIPLSPLRRTSPVILFGGLNGGGKTTLLDALQLVLYGKLARCSNRGNRGYHEFLRDSIHRAVSPGEGAAIELTLTHRSDGQERVYRVHRAWSDNGKGLRERLEVEVDGQRDAFLTRQWPEFVEDLLPVRIADLFFFDGEKIEAFADTESAAALLGTAVHSLLGLDVVDQLQTDLIALERRKRADAASPEERAAIDDLAMQVDTAEAEVRRLKQARAGAKNVFDRAMKLFRDANDAFQRQGGELYNKRVELESERALLDWEIEGVHSELRDLAHGVAPLYLTRDLLFEVFEQAAEEQQAEHDELLVEILADRDAGVIAHLSDVGVAPQARTALAAFLENDRRRRAPDSGTRRYLELARPALDQLQQLTGDSSAALKKSANELVARADRLETLRDEHDRTLAAIPAKDAIARLIERRDRAQDDVEAARQRLNELDTQIDRAAGHETFFKTRLAAQLEATARDAFTRQDARRLLDHSDRVRKTLHAFRTAIVERHTKRIAGFILESFQALLRKERLVTALSIDAETFAIEMTGADGGHVTAARLSAGERQLLAVSILSGLARASGRPLPVVIDTPMGRLDSTHRRNLVDRYFPMASHQVILLSTDEEIDRDAYAAFEPSISRSYTLAYDETTRSTHITQGYFWDGMI